VCRTGRRVVLITDNAPTHIIISAEEEKEHELRVFNLSHIKVVFLPPNVTSKAQPLDQGIIASLKAHYRRYLVKWILDEANKPGREDMVLRDLAPTIYQTLRWLHTAWTEDVKCTTIQNCWRKPGMLPIENEADPGNAVVDDVREAVDILAADMQDLQRLVANDDQLITAADFTELDGESEEVHEVLEDDEIIECVTSVNADCVDSDESDSDVRECTTTIQEAICHANQLEAFSLSRPDKICPRMISMLGDLRQQLTQLSLEERVQTKMQDYFRRSA
jgi:hypothetical protein